MQASPEAFLLLSLPNCTLSSKDFSESGPLGLQCVTVPIPEASRAEERDVYLVLRLNMSEMPIDPARTIQRSDTPTARVYTFYSTPTDPNEIMLTVPTPPGDAKSTPLHEDLGTFEGILEQYAIDFRSPTSSSAQAQAQSRARAVPNEPPPSYVSDDKDLRGHLVMINEDTGEVIGQVEDRFRIREDPVMYQRGHENDPVVIEVPDEAGLRESDASAMEAFARIVPPDQRDWITKSATVVRYVVIASIPSSWNFSILIITCIFHSTYIAMRSRSPPICWSRQSRPHPTTTFRNLPLRRITRLPTWSPRMRKRQPHLLLAVQTLVQHRHLSHHAQSSFLPPNALAKAFEPYTLSLDKPSKSVQKQSKRSTT